MRWMCIVAVMAITIGSAATVQAATVTETTDAGATMPTAMVLPSGTTQVNGVLTPSGDEDLYKFSVSAAATYDIYLGTSPFDDNLILFNGLGQGLEGDDDGGSGFDSRIIRSLAPGDYFIGVGVNNMYGYTAGNVSFISNDSGALGSPTASTLGYINSIVSSRGSYVMTFSPATSGNLIPLPAAAWMGLSLLGGLGVTRRLRRRTR